MPKIFKSIRFKYIFQNKIKKYVFYAIGEIILVVIGILIALKINNWNTQKVKKQEEIEIYKNIKDQISQNLEEIKVVKNKNEFYGNQYEFANHLISSKNFKNADTLAIMAMNLSKYSDFNGNGNVFETLVNSGDFKLIENTEIQNKLQKLQSTYSYMNKLEDIHWEIIMKELSPELRGVINYSNLQIVKPDKLYSVELQNIFIESIFLTKGKDAVYNLALTEINNLTNLIDNELKKYPAN